MLLPVRRLPLTLAALLAAAAAGPGAGAASGSVRDPSVNRPLSSETFMACSQAPASGACVSSALGQINAARAAEGVPPMVLPAGFTKMSIPVQLLNLSDLERIDRGLTPITGLSAALDRDAQLAADEGRDPMPSQFLGTAATGNWSGGLSSTLEADFEWMYDDGVGSPNIDCSRARSAGCWGHRHDILWSFSGPVAMGAGTGTSRYGVSMTELFVGGDRATGAGGRDAPVVRPAAVASAAAGGPQAHRPSRPRAARRGHRHSPLRGARRAGRRHASRARARRAA